MSCQNRFNYHVLPFTHKLGIHRIVITLTLPVKRYFIFDIGIDFKENAGGGGRVSFIYEKIIADGRLCHLSRETVERGGPC
jgi:hypothetical protein